MHKSNSHRFGLLVSFIAMLFVSINSQANEKLPQAIQNLADQGVIIYESFQAPSGLEAFVGSVNGRPVALYLSTDKKHVLVGQLLDEQGNNLTEDELEQRVVGPQNERAWSELEKADWVQDGKKDAPIILYAFMDPNCPYCHRFREQAEPWVKSGKVQIRHIVVGILGQNSLEKAATINGSKNTTEAFLNNQHQFERNGISIDKKAVSAGLAITEKNNNFMQSLGLTGAPAIYYQARGKTEVARGLPQGEAFNRMMGE